MEDCQDERYCPFCGQKAELDGTQYHALFCTTAPASLTSLGERAQTLAARMGQEQSGTVLLDTLHTKFLKEEEIEDHHKFLLERYYALFNVPRVDPDGALTPLPTKPLPQRTVSAPTHDFIGALYKPYMSPI